MRYLVVIVSILALAACSKSSSPFGGGAASESKPSGCGSPVTTGMHDFVQWDTLASTTYDCQIPEAPLLDCQYFQADNGHREIQCENPSGVIQSLNSSCTLVLSGSRDFFTSNRTFTATRELSADAYDCGVKYGLRCEYYRHDPDATDAHTYEDVVCDDNQLPK